MSFLEKLKERAEVVRHAAKDSIKALLVPDEIKAERLSYCNSCEFLFEPTMQCKKCGCFVNAKTAIAPFKCPIGKWPAVTLDQNKVDR